MAVKKTGYILGAIAGVGVATAALGGVGAIAPHGSSIPRETLPLTRVSTAPVFAPPPGAPQSFADIFEKVSPAVVSIDVTSKVDPKTLRDQLRQFGLPFNLPDQGDDGQQQPAKPREALSSGSGFFISADGYIVTNNHVVENASDIKVILKDETELKATIVGRDEATDLAVIKVEPKGKTFPFVNFENSARPRVGDWVITIGNPFGLGGTATAGIISAYGRALPDPSSNFVDYVQIDAPINRGNSGGPSFDIYGRVIGVNTAIFSPSGGSVGIGFAIPADVAERVTAELIRGGKVVRGYMGATIQNLTPDVAESLGRADLKGALVADLVPGGPADKAGVRQGDVVVAVDGKPVTSSTELTRAVAATHAGEAFRLDIIRAGKPVSVTIKSGVRPSERDLNAGNDNDDESGPGAGQGGAAIVRPKALGLSLAPIDAEARQRFNLAPSVKGVVIDAVDPDSDAGKKGVKRGYVIQRAGDQAVNSPADVLAAVDAARKAGRTNVLLLIYADGRALFLPVKLDSSSK